MEIGLLFGWLLQEGLVKRVMGVTGGIGEGVEVFSSEVAISGD